MGITVINEKKPAGLLLSVGAMTSIKQLKLRKSQKMILLVQYIAQNVTVQRSNIIFCDFCGFSCLMEETSLTGLHCVITRKFLY